MIVTRFAPSPTGLLHLGHAYAAIVAQQSGERFVVRIEDLDEGRSRAAFIEAILFDLKWLGLSWDEPVLRRGQRGPAYAAALDRLAAMDVTYPCFCTRQDIADEIARAGEAQHGPDGPLYPGTCRALSASEGAERIRGLLLGTEEKWESRAEALLFAAARADHLDKLIRPALERGSWVLCDRFVDSSLAYQGGAGGLGIETVREINAFAIDGWYPDRTLVLVLEEGSERARTRDANGSDRIGGRSDDYHRRVDAAFQILAAEEPERIQLVDASGSPERVTARLIDVLKDLLP